VKCPRSPQGITIEWAALHLWLMKEFPPTPAGIDGNLSIHGTTSAKQKQALRRNQTEEAVRVIVGASGEEELVRLAIRGGAATKTESPKLQDSNDISA